MRPKSRTHVIVIEMFRYPQHTKMGSEKELVIELYNDVTDSGCSYQKCSDVNNIFEPYRTMMLLLRAAAGQHGAASIDGIGKLQLGIPYYNNSGGCTGMAIGRLYTLEEKRNCTILLEGIGAEG